jgi:hypothetical protein
VGHAIVQTARAIGPSTMERSNERPGCPATVSWPVTAAEGGGADVTSFP